jgi:putative thioredoxin
MSVATLGLSESEREAIARFQRDVIEPSMSSLVVLQFTADWCGPCKQLSPILDKVAADYASKGVKLVRLDVDKEKLIAGQFRIQSIPTVYALYQGQPIADLTNYRTEAQLGRVLDQLLGQLNIQSDDSAAEAEIEPLIEMAEQVLSEGDAARAANIFAQIREMAPEHPAVLGGMIRALVADAQTEEARRILDSASEDQRKSPEVARAEAALELASASPAGETAELEARVATNPDDHQARFDLASAMMSAGDRDGAADALLEIIARDKDWNEGEARKRFLQLLEAQGIADPWARAQRRRLSALLFT